MASLGLSSTAIAEQRTADHRDPNPAAHAQSGATAAAAAVRITVSVDGNLTPEQVPDDVAYFQFFRVLGKQNSTDPALEERRRRGYLQFFFNRSCVPPAKDRPLTQGEIDQILAVADDVSKRLAAIDSAAPGPPHADPKALHRQRLDVAAAAAASLGLVVGPEVAARIQAHVGGHVKRRMKLVLTTMSGPSQ